MLACFFEGLDELQMSTRDAPDPNKTKHVAPISFAFVSIFELPLNCLSLKGLNLPMFLWSTGGVFCSSLKITPQHHEHLPTHNKTNKTA